MFRDLADHVSIRIRVVHPGVYTNVSVHAYMHMAPKTP